MTLAPEYQEIIDRIDGKIAARRHARKAGIALSTNSDRLSTLERQGIDSLVALVEDALDHHVDDDEKVTAIVQDLTKLFADSLLLAKVLGGYEMEWRVFDEGRPDGMVGRAVDAAVEALRPYWERKL